MSQSSQVHVEKTPLAYLSFAGAWALAFGCSVGWGSFVMPGTTFLPVAGPVGTALGICIGAAAMLILGMNYHYLMNHFSGRGGVYSYTKYCFGYDHGFISAWFLILTYIAIIWANATALPLIVRTVMGNVFRFGFDYDIAGYHIYAGEILLACLSLLAAGLICLRRKAAVWVQTLMAFVLLGGVVFVFLAAFSKHSFDTGVFTPAYAPGQTPSAGVLTIISLAPWAFVGFESISHSTAEAKFQLKKTFLILACAVVSAAVAYSFLSLLAVTALPEGVSSWVEYVASLDRYSGIMSQPTFFAAYSAMGKAGSLVLGLAAVCGVFTGLIGNYIALSRLLCAMSEDGLLGSRVGRTNKNHVPVRALFCIFAISVFLPFLGRTAISWIVDVTTIGATIAYAYASASTFKTAHQEQNFFYTVVGLIGLIVSLLFAFVFLVPNIMDVKTLSNESYFILAAWGILGLLYFRYLFRKDKEGHYGRSVVVWVILFALIIYASSIWMVQETGKSIDGTVEPIRSMYADQLYADGETETAGLYRILDSVKRTHMAGCMIHVALIAVALLILFDIYRMIQAREKRIEVEKALAEESSKAKTSFLSNMSHEIRTPMNAIIGLDNIALKNPDLPAKTREQLEKIGASAKHLLGLINDILDMSRIESGRMPLKNEEFSSREFLDQINTIVNGQCVDKGLSYDCQVIGHIADYYIGDDLKLKQILINILGNSVKFTDPPGSVTLMIEETACFEGMCTLRFTMRDTGIGMDKEYIPKVFESFSQEDATSTNRYGGSGLGMAITKNFVEMMNGEIEVQSEKGVGSVFIVTVTLKVSSHSARLEHGISLPSPLRVMVVDDDAISCEHVQMVLRTIGVEADINTDSARALQLIREAYDRKEAYHLLLTDYRMPGMNGLELARAVHSFDGGQTAVIILTGYNRDDFEEDARDDGIDGIMSKPLFSDSLLREIHGVLLKKAGMEPSEIENMEDADRNLAGYHVLMAEDVEQNAEILQDLLELEEVSVDHAVNGARAVEMFDESPEGYYAAVLMDVRMPVMDGLAATRKIRALPRPDAKTVPIIAMTANVYDEDVERSLQAGMNVHLSKPIEPDRLYDTLARLIVAKKA